MGIFSQLGSSIGAVISGSIENKRVQNEIETQKLKTLRKNVYKQEVYDQFKGDYFGFAGGLKNCLQSNDTRLGISYPRRVEDILVF